EEPEEGEGGRGMSKWVRNVDLKGGDEGRQQSALRVAVPPVADAEVGEQYDGLGMQDWGGDGHEALEKQVAAVVDERAIGLHVEHDRLAGVDQKRRRRRQTQRDAGRDQVAGGAVLPQHRLEDVSDV